MRNLVVGITLATVMSANANAFIFEANLNSTKIDTEISNNQSEYETSIDQLTLDGTIYFQQVSVDNGPWREASFLSKASSFQVRIIDGEQDIDGVSAKGDVEGLDLKLRTVMGSFVMELSHSTKEYSLSSSGIGSLGVSDEDWAILAPLAPFGREEFNFVLTNDPMLQDSIISNFGMEIVNVATTFSTEVTDDYLKLGGYIGNNKQWHVKLRTGEVEGQTDYSGIGGGYKHVILFSSGKALTILGSMDLLSVNYDVGEDLTQAELNLGIAFYPIKNLALIAGIESVAGLSSASVEDTDEEDPDYTRRGLHLGVSYYPIEQMQLSLLLSQVNDEHQNYDYSTGLGDKEENDVTTMSFGIGMRF